MSPLVEDPAVSPSSMNRLAADLDHVLSGTEGLWDEVRNGRIFMTGGTGFFGSWLLESLLWANDSLGLNVRAVVLTRDPAAFTRKAPHLAGHVAVQLYTGDIESGTLPDGPFSHVIHAASDLQNRSSFNPVGLMETTFQGVRRVLEQARKGASKVLYISSGAVYGPSAPERHKLKEDDPATPIPLEPRGAYAEAKRMGEMLAALVAREHGFELKVARGFAFIGPYLSLDSEFAASSFLRDALAGRDITVRGTGTAVRSYLYGADLAVWCWTILFKGVAGRPYNVGSNVPVSIADLAYLIARECDPPVAVRVLERPDAGELVDYYVPDTARAQTELGLDAVIPLPEAVRRTLRWHSQTGCRR
jgi:nucleoside-diphosphate-sugar epimerase